MQQSITGHYVAIRDAVHNVTVACVATERMNERFVRVYVLDTGESRVVHVDSIVEIGNEFDLGATDSGLTVH